MAKIITSAVVGDVRNKAGGIVFTKTRFGSMVRRKVSPIQPRSSTQMNVRADFTGLSKGWAGLTEAQRAAWIAFCESYPGKDIFGQTAKLTGHQMYVRLNRALKACGQTQISDAPTSLTVNYAGPITVAHDGPPVTTITVTWATPGNIGGSECTSIYATAPMSAGRAAGGARFRQIFYSGLGLPGPFNVGSEYIAKFGVPPVGRKVFIRAILTRNTNGAQSLASEYALTI